MKTRWILLTLLLICSAAHAQDDKPKIVSGPRILQINPEGAAALAEIGKRQDMDAVSLDLTSGEIEAQEGGKEALLAWVKNGGVALLHNEVAEWFGYSTVPAREATTQLAGQLYGRAVAALPPGAHPLLWDNPGNTTNANAPGGGTRAPTEAPGVRLVYYQMNEGDHLVTEHPAAVPLLRVTDLAVVEDAPLYAAAIAPFGKGWAVFTPTYIEPKRADGALFVDNLMRWIGGVAAARRASADAKSSETEWYSVPATFVEAASDAASRADGGLNAATTLKELYKTFQSAKSTAAPEDVANDDAPRLMVGRDELTSLAALLNGAIKSDAKAQTQAATMLLLMRARLELQRAQVKSAEAWAQRAAALSPKSADVLVWQGVLTAGRAENLTLSSRDRAALLARAAQFWTAAIGTAQATSQNKMIGGVPMKLVQSWIEVSGRRAQLMNVEPPLVALLGNQDNPVVLRHFDQDATLRLALPAGDLLPRASEAAGWRADVEEILIFPTLAYYQAYRAAAGLGEPVIADASGAGGDVVDNRILLISQPALPVILPSATPGGQPRIVQFGTAVPIIISRLHAYVLMNQLVRDGNPPPAWMQIGLVTLANLSVTTNLGLDGVDKEILRRTEQADGLLTPEQFRAALADVRPGGAVEAQAARLLAYFYARFGTGGVVETLQRLGAGQTTDEALLATTGLSEEEFFLAWRNAEFTVR